MPGERFVVIDNSSEDDPVKKKKDELRKKMAGKGFLAGMQKGSEGSSTGSYRAEELKQHWATKKESEDSEAVGLNSKAWKRALRQQQQSGKEIAEDSKPPPEVYKSVKRDLRSEGSTEPSDEVFEKIEDLWKLESRRAEDRNVKSTAEADLPGTAEVSEAESRAVDEGESAESDIQPVAAERDTEDEHDEVAELNAKAEEDLRPGLQERPAEPDDEKEDAVEPVEEEEPEPAEVEPEPTPDEEAETQSESEQETGAETEPAPPPEEEPESEEDSEDEDTAEDPNEFTEEEVRLRNTGETASDDEEDDAAAVNDPKQAAASDAAGAIEATEEIADSGDEQSEDAKASAEIAANEDEEEPDSAEARVVTAAERDTEQRDLAAEQAAEQSEIIAAQQSEDEAKIKAEQFNEEQIKAQEHLGQMLMTAAETEALIKAEKRERSEEADEAKRAESKKTGVEKLAEKLSNEAAVLPNGKRVETLSRSELLSMSERIVIDGNSLRQIYETHLIGERGLRRLITEHLLGRDLKQALRREIVEREIDFERDPDLRDMTLPQQVSTSSGGGNAALTKLLSQVMPNADNDEEVAFFKARAAYEALEQQKYKKRRSIIDISLAILIAALISTLIVVFLIRH